MQFDALVVINIGPLLLGNSEHCLLVKPSDRIKNTIFKVIDFTNQNKIYAILNIIESVQHVYFTREAFCLPIK